MKSYFYSIGYFQGDGIPGIVITPTKPKLKITFNNSQDLLDHLNLLVHLKYLTIKVYGWCFDDMPDFENTLFKFSHESSEYLYGSYSGFGSGSVEHNPEEIIELFNQWIKGKIRTYPVQK